MSVEFGSLFSANFLTPNTTLGINETGLLPVTITYTNALGIFIVNATVASSPLWVWVLRVRARGAGGSGGHAGAGVAGGGDVGGLLERDGLRERERRVRLRPPRQRRQGPHPPPQRGNRSPTLLHIFHICLGILCFAGYLSHYEIHISVNGSANETVIVGNDTIAAPDFSTYALNYTIPSFPRGLTVR